MISEPGSYYMTGPIPIEEGKHGVTITTSGVNTQDGVRTTGFQKGVVVRNGTVRFWGGSGINLSSNGDGHMIENVVAIENGITGINAGRESLVTGCIANSNGASGIFANRESIVSGCNAAKNAFNGITVNQGGRVVDSVASVNGVNGIEMRNGFVSGCVVRENGDIGIVVRDGVVESCTVIDNVGNGISTTSSSAFNITQRGVIRNNYVEGNGIAGNDAGIFVSTQNTTIEGNTLIANAFGIRVTRANGNNLVIADRAFENTSNYFIVAGNPLGPIVPIASQSNLSSVINADHPQANFSR